MFWRCASLFALFKVPLPQSGAPTEQYVHLRAATASLKIGARVFASCKRGRGAGALFLVARTCRVVVMLMRLAVRLLFPRGGPNRNRFKYLSACLYTAVLFAAECV